MTSNLIRTLYVGFSLSGDPDATGNTLKQIFHGTEDIDFMQYCLDYDPALHASVFDTVYISPRKSKMFYLLKQFYRSDGDSYAAKSATANAERRGNSFIALAKALLDVLPKSVDEPSQKRIDDFSPQLIYTLGENITTLKHAIKQSKRYNAPIVLHIMDDFEPKIYGYTKLTAPWRKKYLKLLEQAYSRSVKNLAISPKMAREYEERHSKPFDFAMNCLSELHPQPKPCNSPLRMVFSGGLHGGRAESLAKIADIISGDVRLNGKLTLTVYTSEGNIALYKDQLEKKLDLRPYVPKEEMYANLGQADILIHVESFLPEEINYFRLSMSTKIPECMSVGRPIFCYGPSEICTVSYIRDKGVGVVAENETDAAEAMICLVTAPELRFELGAKALEIAEKEHLKPSVEARVKACFKYSMEEFN